MSNKIITPPVSGVSASAPDARETGVALIAKERQRQIQCEGWTPEHDDAHGRGDLARAAACYALYDWRHGETEPEEWPWAPEWWKPTRPRTASLDDKHRAWIRDLTKAGALIAAEIDRLQRLATRASPPTVSEPEP